MVKLILLLVLATAVFTSCGGGGVQDENLVGIWRWDEYGGFTYIFHADGTGVRGFNSQVHGVEVETFRWNARDGRLNINRDDAPRNEIRNERWDYTIENYTLTINSRQERGMTYSYLLDSGQQDNTLFGTWVWNEDTDYTFIFNADGTGTRGYVGDYETFFWSSTGNRLDINSPFLVWGVECERRTFTVSGNNLNLNSQQAVGLVFDYTRN
jgi:hypothetical protein